MKTPKLLPNQSRTQLPPGDYVTTTAAARNLATAASRILFNFPQKHFVLFCYFMLFSSLVFFSNESAAQRKARIPRTLLLHGYAMSNTCHAAPYATSAACFFDLLTRTSVEVRLLGSTHQTPPPPHAGRGRVCLSATGG